MQSDYMKDFIQFCQNYQYQVRHAELKKGCGHDQRTYNCNEGWTVKHEWFYHVRHDWGYIVFTQDWKVYHANFMFHSQDAVNVVVMQAQLWLEAKNEEINTQKGGPGRKAKKRWSLW